MTISHSRLVKPELRAQRPVLSLIAGRRRRCNWRYERLLEEASRYHGQAKRKCPKDTARSYQWRKSEWIS